jgi:hypothetical protein
MKDSSCVANNYRLSWCSVKKTSQKPQTLRASMIKIILSVLLLSGAPCLQASHRSPKISPHHSPRTQAGRISPTNNIGFNPDGSEMSRGFPARPASAPRVHSNSEKTSASPIIIALAAAAAAVVAVPLLNLSAPEAPAQS